MPGGVTIQEGLFIMESVRPHPPRTVTLLLLTLLTMFTARETAAVEPDVADIQYGQVAGQGLHLDLYLPASGAAPYPLVIHLHGGGWFSGDKYPLDDPVLELLNTGVAIASVQYRLTGNHWDHGDNLTFPAQIHDIKGATRWLRANAAAYNLDPTRFGVWGSSAGGHLAALLGTSGGVAELEGTIGGNLEHSSRVQVAANYFGPCDLMNENPDFMGMPGHQDQDFYFSTRSRLIGWSREGEGIGDIRANQDNPDAPYPTLVDMVWDASPLAHVSADDPPFFIAHGTLDQEVPVLQATKLEQALLAVGVDVEKHIIDGVGHDELPPSVDEDLVDFLLAKLTVDASPPTPPTLNSAVPVSDSQIDLSWSAGSDPDTGIAEYVLYRDSAVAARVAGSQFSYSDTGLDADTSFDYEIAAVNGQLAESAPSNLITAQTLADLTPPQIEFVDGSGVPTVVRVVFDESLDPASAEDELNYSITPGITVHSASLQPGGRTAVLTTSAHNPGASYTLTVTGVEDLAGNRRSNSRRSGGPLIVNYTFEPRVRDGLVVLYDFEQGSGLLVPDVSGVGDPMDLEILVPGDVAWTEHGLELTAPTEVASLFWATKIIEACEATDELTLETWVTPANTTQDGPARMITLSSVYHKRNFTLGPGQLEWVWLVRSTETDTNGVPLLVSPWGDVSTSLTHVICTWDSSGMSRIYVNGQLRASDLIGGELTPWAHCFRFVLGNEPVDDGGSDIDWLGEFHLVSVYSRALTAAEVQANYEAGADPDETCPADIDGDDGEVNVFDLILLLSNWNTDGPGAEIAPPTDVVDVFDLIELLDQWGSCP